ncbi:MAG: DUF262 domain-containing HNH endonuclease family protein [Gammaproteobacteria bacterium]|nr:DUF262 domain-containing HNH endonuclease family protein [Gammaproteobacteria bacterium]MDD9869774.1 DUF262 domain-containing HNH endonuclease family protein [Gammaproteobacteria bacterium]
MDAHVNSLDEVLQERQQWLVPVYQRHYAWKSGKGEQIPGLWEDWRDQTLAILKGATLFPHYFGAIICSKPKSPGFGVIPQRYLVDGQQRITTFQLMLASLREAARELGYDDLDDAINTYLFNTLGKAARNPERERFKLWPSAYDRDLYKKVASLKLKELRQHEKQYFYKNGRLKKDKDVPKLLQAYFFLYAEILFFVRIRHQEEGETIEKVIDALMRGFLNGFRIVTIHLHENDDAQEIFASLNGKAEPLAPFDLIRNDIFHRALKEEADEEQLFNEQWREFEQDFWNKLVKQGRFKKARADHFIAHVVVAETEKEVNIRKIATEYQNYARERSFDSVKNELNVLLDYGRTYRALEERPEGAITNRIASVLRTWDLSSFHPVVLWIDSSSVNDDGKCKMFSIIENYIVRREICGLTSKNYNKIVAGLIREARRKENIVEAFMNQLQSLSGDASRMPHDRDVFLACEQSQAYTVISREKLRYIFENIEKEMRNKFDEDVSVPNLSIEHIMPRKWAENWALSNGSIAPSESYGPLEKLRGEHLDEETQKLIQKRQQLINTFGNLTLVTTPLNSSLSNGPWEGKKEQLAGSLLALNRDISKKENWDESAIAKRASTLAGHINKIWPDVS